MRKLEKRPSQNERKKEKSNLIHKILFLILKTKFENIEKYLLKTLLIISKTLRKPTFGNTLCSMKQKSQHFLPQI